MSVDEHEMRHDLLVYDSDDGFASYVGLFVEEGIEAGHRVVVVTDPVRRTVLTDTLSGADAEAVLFADRDGVYTRPEAAIATYEATLRALLAEGAEAVRVYGELPECSESEEWQAWLRYEAIVERVFSQEPVWVTCGYDSRAVPPEVIDCAWRLHREVHAHGWQENPHYHDPVEVLRSLAQEAGELADLRALPLVANEQTLRRLLERELASAGVEPDVAADLLVAAIAVLDNAERHGGGLTGLRAGRVQGRFVCEISDSGPGLDDPYAGYAPPRRRRDPAGLWHARQRTAQLDLLPRESGLTVRLWV